jgi:AmiR/NasT family two-component response regulator
LPSDLDAKPRTEGLRVLAADEDEDALLALGRLLEELGHDVIARPVSINEIAAEIRAEEPEIALVKLHSDEEHALSLIEEIIDDANCPVVAVLNEERPEFIGEAAERGIYSYARPQNKEAVQSAIELAVRRHAELERLGEAVDQLEGALHRRAAIERAKGILMERHSIEADDAFEMLRDHARSHNQKLVEVARAVDEGHPLLVRRGEPAPNPRKGG